MVTQQKFDKVMGLFSELEDFRGEIYPMSLNLLDNKFANEAYLLILAIWNNASFRYVINDFDFRGFTNLMKLSKSYFERLDREVFNNAEFGGLENEIKRIYTPLSKIKGIKYTGASKIMHLRVPKLFVMWDGYIRKNYGIETQDYKGYMKFLEEMQSEFKDISTGDRNRTKSIDEFNYVSISRLEILKGKIKETDKKIEKKRKKDKNTNKDEDKLAALFNEKKKIEDALS